MTGIGSVEIFSTSPQSLHGNSETYLSQVVEVARWSEEAGCRGILVYTDNGLVDPWLVAQLILENTERIAPLVAVQPVYMHPYAVAKMVASYAFLHQRRVYLNMVAGGFRNDLLALGDETPHDDRYGRMVEYTLIIRRLLQGDAVTFAGEYYTVKNLKMTPPLPPHLFPGIFSSGSSAAGFEAAGKIGSVAVKYPKPPGEEEDVRNLVGQEVGCRVGIIARDSAEEAWRVAHERFPEDRKGQLTHQLAMKVTDSEWHRQLSVRPGDPPSPRNPYWLGPFHNYKTFCPYLVGTYEAVAELLARYLSLGYQKVILDIPPSREELDHTATAFRKAGELLGQ